MSQHLSSQKTLAVYMELFLAPYPSASPETGLAMLSWLEVVLREGRVFLQPASGQLSLKLWELAAMSQVPLVI
jgi:hypothetical protein